MNRGSAAEAVRNLLLYPPSMRPRFMNRGSPAQHPAESLAVRAFNEAPIHESGKCRAAVRGRAASGDPSMRPRFMNRGSQATRRSARPRSFAFNEAPIHESGKSHR